MYAVAVYIQYMNDLHDLHLLKCAVYTITAHFAKYFIPQCNALHLILDEWAISSSH